MKSLGQMIKCNEKVSMENDFKVETTFESGIRKYLFKVVKN